MQDYEEVRKKWGNIQYKMGYVWICKVSYMIRTFDGVAIHDQQATSKFGQHCTSAVKMVSPLAADVHMNTRLKICGREAWCWSMLQVDFSKMKVFINKGTPQSPIYRSDFPL